MKILTDKKIAIIRARLGSSRFPNKVLSKIGDKPALQILIERVRKSKLIDEILLITTTDKEDDALELFAEVNGIECYRDSNVVLKKTLKASFYYNADIIIDLTADCPFIDANEIDKLILKLYLFKADYTSNIKPRNLPIGFDIQVYKRTALYETLVIKKEKAHYNHSGWNILYYCKGLKFKHNKVNNKYNFPDWRVVLDYPEDLILLNKIYDHFQDIHVSQWDIIKYLKNNPELLEINKDCRQKNPNEG